MTTQFTLEGQGNQHSFFHDCAFPQQEVALISIYARNKGVHSAHAALPGRKNGLAVPLSSF
jgi:hypothetical protein